MTTECKHPEIEVQLTGNDGNAFTILGLVRGALARGGVHRIELDKFRDEAMSGDYDHLLVTCMNWVTVK